MQNSQVSKHFSCQVFHAGSVPFICLSATATDAQVPFQFPAGLENLVSALTSALPDDIPLLPFLRLCDYCEKSIFLIRLDLCHRFVSSPSWFLPADKIHRIFRVPMFSSFVKDADIKKKLQ